LSPVPPLRQTSPVVVPKATSHAPSSAPRAADVLNKPKAINVLKPTDSIEKATVLAETNPVRNPMAHAAMPNTLVVSNVPRSPQASIAMETAVSTKPSQVLKAMLRSTIVVIKLTAQHRKTTVLVTKLAAPLRRTMDPAIKLAAQVHKTTVLVTKLVARVRRTTAHATRLVALDLRAMISVLA
jgi:hypothetical protein